MPEVAKALHAALPNIEISTLVAYANQTGDKSLGSRLGLLLEKLGHPVTDLIFSESPVKLDPGRARHDYYAPRWRVSVNVADEDLFPAGVG